MGVTERKEREKQEMRVLILSTAAELIVEKGYDNTSIRNIAEAIEYSPATIYLYFKNKSELFYALSEEGFRRFFRYFQQVPPEGRAIDRLKALGGIYLRFAFEHPAYYNIMFLMEEPMEARQAEHQWESGEKSHHILVSSVEQCIEEGHFQGQDPTHVSFMVWSCVHGLATFRLRCRMRMYKEEEHDQILYGALEVFNDLIDNA